MQMYQSTYLPDSLSLSWIGYMYIVSLNDEMMDINFAGLQDEIYDLYGLRGHFQSVWITLKGGVHQNIQTGESPSLSELTFPPHMCRVDILLSDYFHIHHLS